MGSKAKVKLNEIFEVKEIPDRFKALLNEDQKLFACAQSPNQTTVPQFEGYEFFGTGNRLWYYIKNETE